MVTRVWGSHHKRIERVYTTDWSEPCSSSGPLLSFLNHMLGRVSNNYNYSTLWHLVLLFFRHLLQRGGRWGQPSWIWGAQASRVLDPGTLFWSSTFTNPIPGSFFLNPNTFQFLILDLWLDLGTFLHPRSSIYLVSWILKLSSIMGLFFSARSNLTPPLYSPVKIHLEQR